MVTNNLSEAFLQFQDDLTGSPGDLSQLFDELLEVWGL